MSDHQRFVGPGVGRERFDDLVEDRVSRKELGREVSWVVPLAEQLTQSTRKLRSPFVPPPTPSAPPIPQPTARWRPPPPPPSVPPPPVRVVMGQRIDAPAPPPPLPPSTAPRPRRATQRPSSIGRYQILGAIGEGGMASLYLGRAAGPGGFERLAAIKTIHPHLCRDQAFIAMFLDEARIAARVHHPNVVPVYEVGKDQGRLFIAMDYVAGETLGITSKFAWTSGVGFPVDLAAYVVWQACEALHAAHELTDASGRPLGVIHRDVSPQNILLGYNGTVQLTDFGIARAEDQLSKTVPGIQKGKYAYMAPEQLRGEAMDRRVDIFALGIVLWETTVGRRLFKGADRFDTMQRVLDSAVPPPSVIRDDFPRDLEAVIMRALARCPEDRYPTARALGLDLRAVLAARARSYCTVDVEDFMARVFPGRRNRLNEALRQAMAGVERMRTVTTNRILADAVSGVFLV